MILDWEQERRIWLHNLVKDLVKFAGWSVHSYVWNRTSEYHEGHMAAYTGAVNLLMINRASQEINHRSDIVTHQLVVMAIECSKLDAVSKDWWMFNMNNSIDEVAHWIIYGDSSAGSQE